MTSDDLTQEQALSLFEYRDGILFWAARPANCTTVGTVAGSLTNQGYTRITIQGRRYLRHRLIFLMHHGRWPAGETDHINRIKGDDRIENLREVTQSQNQNNSVRIERALGYSWSRKARKWHARLQRRGATTSLGFHAIEDEARSAFLGARAAFVAAYTSFSCTTNQREIPSDQGQPRR
jgi:hypothetical protein